ncbi:unnamed protein product, partial [Trichobilharzia regenti]
WISKPTDNEWHGVINGKLWRLRQIDSSKPVEYYTLDKPTNTRSDLTDIPSDLFDYFRLGINLSDLIKEWCIRDEWFTSRFSDASSTDTARGLRLMRQDPVETLFAFITSANNNLTRITKLLYKLCSLYGDPLYLDDDGDGNVGNWTFPSLEVLAQPKMISELQNIGFGYRSKFIVYVVGFINFVLIRFLAFFHEVYCQILLKF